LRLGRVNEPPIQLELDLTFERCDEAVRLGRSKRAWRQEAAKAWHGGENSASGVLGRHRLMEAICEEENVAAAVQAVMRKKGAPGVDGMTVK
jgi:hypothetical protein